MSGKSFSNDKFQKALGNSLRDFPHITGLKAEQERCIKSIAGKYNVFRILPNGFVDRERSPSYPQSHVRRATMYIHVITPFSDRARSTIPPKK